MAWSARDFTLLWLAIVPVAAIFAFVEPYPQPGAYHEFADNRLLVGVPNLCNVASNLLFLVFGVAGLRALRRNELAIIHGLRHTCLVLYVGIAATALGSGWFHLSPDNDTLFWDRLPMTVAFMSLFVMIIGEHVSEDLARILFVPLLIAGAASVFYWDYTESVGAGDLRLYGVVQFLPMLLIPAVLLMYRSAFDSVAFLWVAFGLYALAKLFEALDVQIYSFGNIISGHSLKHVAASLVPLVLLRGMRARQRTA